MRCGEGSDSSGKKQGREVAVKEDLEKDKGGARVGPRGVPPLPPSRWYVETKEDAGRGRADSPRKKKGSRDPRLIRWYDAIGKRA